MLDIFITDLQQNKNDKTTDKLINSFNEMTK